MLSILGRSVNVVEERRNLAVKRGAESSAPGICGNVNRSGRSVEADTVSMKTPSSGSSVPISRAAERPR